MNSFCDRQGDILAASRTGALDEPASAHLAGCADCREALIAEESLRGYARELRAAASPSNLEGLLWRAELRRRLHRAEQGARVLALYDRLVLGAGVAGLGLVLVWKWEEVRVLIGRWLYSGSNPPLVLTGLTALLVLSLMGWLMTLWAEE